MPGEGTPPRRFLVLGLPRSGTTYLMTLLNSHHQIFCTGEQFNPQAVVGIAERDESHQAVLDRDRAPTEFVQRFFEEAADRQRGKWVGFKFMIGHNIEVLKSLENDPDLTLIYVWRDNRLAQASSMIKAARSKNWAQTRRDANIEEKIHVTPRTLSQRWHEFATYDYLFQSWLKDQPHRKITLEYRELFQPGFEARICDFLDVAFDPGMKSPLVKQNPNTVLDRFVDPKPIRYYFTQVGHADWLESEL